MSGKVGAFNAFLWDAAEEGLQPLHTFSSHCDRDLQFSQAVLQWCLGVSLLICLSISVFLIFLNALSSRGPSGLSITSLFQVINFLRVLNSENSKEKAPVDSLITFPKCDLQE